MRKQSKAFQSKRSGNRAMPALAHQIGNDKTWQLAAAYGLMNLLRRVGDYWLPRNVRSGTDLIAGIAPHMGIRAVTENMHKSGGTVHNKVAAQYVRRGVHNEA